MTHILRAVLLASAIVAGAQAQRLSVGRAHALKANSDGTVWAWGENGWGQLGDGTTVFRSRPVQVIGLTDVVAVSAGEFHSLALRSDGTVWIWGQPNALRKSDSPKQLNAIASPAFDLTDVAAIEATFAGAIVLRRDGTVWAWGEDSFGGATNVFQPASSVRLQQVEGLSHIVRISAGVVHVLALRDDGAVLAWGRRSNYLLGTPRPAGEDDFRYVPEVVPGLPPAEAIFAGTDVSYAVMEDGAVWGWGAPSYGRILPGVTGRRNTPPTLMPGVDQTDSVCASGSHSLFVKRDGELWGVGSNSSGRLGSSRTADTTTVFRLPLDQPVLAAGCNDSSSFAILQDDSVLAWGANLLLGTGAVVYRDKPAPADLLTNAVQVLPAEFPTLMLGPDGSVSTVGAADVDGGPPTALTAVPGLSGVKSLANQNSSYQALAHDGTVWNWGTVYQWTGGFLGPTTQADPVPVPGLSGVTMLSSNNRMSLALLGDGRVFGWGSDESGQITHGAGGYFYSGFQYFPVEISGLPTGLVAVAACTDHGLALRADGTVWGWGKGANVIHDTVSPDIHPAMIEGLTNITRIACKSTSNFALRDDGTLWAWSSYGLAELGLGRDFEVFNRPISPTQVTGIDHAIDLAVGSTHTVVLRDDGTVWTFGWNTSGQLGNGTTDFGYSPARVPDLSGVRAVAAGATSSFALLADGRVYSWGALRNGALGDGSSAFSTEPAPVLSPTPADLVLAWGSPNTASSGAEITLDLDIANLGGLVPTGPTTLNITLGENLTVQQATSADWTCTADGPTLTCTPAQPTYANSRLTLVLSLSGEASLTARVTTSPDAEESNNQATLQLPAPAVLDPTPGAATRTRDKAVPVI